MHYELLLMNFKVIISGVVLFVYINNNIFVKTKDKKN